MQDRSVSRRKSRNSESYATSTDQPAHFTLLVTTTYERFEDDFLKLLWLIRAKAMEDRRSVGEIREYAAIKDFRQQIFARLCARASIAIARYTLLHFIQSYFTLHLNLKFKSHFSLKRSFT